MLLRPGIVQVQKRHRRQAEEHGGCGRLHRRHPGQRFKQAHLAEEIARLDAGELEFAIGAEGLNHPRLAGQEQVKLVAGLAFAQDDFAGADLESHGICQQPPQSRVVQPGEDRDLPEWVQVGNGVCGVRHVNGSGIGRGVV